MPYLYILCLSLLLLAGLYFIFLGLGLPLKPLSLIGSKRMLLAGLSLACIALEIGFLWLVVTKAPTPQEALVQTYKSTLAHAAATAMRSKLVFPLQVDKDIQLIGIEAEHGTIVNDFVVNTTDTDAFRTVMSQVKAAMQNTACARPDYLQLFKLGLGMELRFHQIATRYTEVLMFMPSQCGF